MKGKEDQRSAASRRLEKELKSQADKAQAVHLQRFFKTGPGQYGAGDIFLGIKVPPQRQIVKEYGSLALPELQYFLDSPIHEFRLVALLIMMKQYQKAQDEKTKEKIVAFYLKNRRRVNNWDLVDLSAPKILGDYLLTHPGKIKLLDKLARSQNLWERRIAILSTFSFICQGRTQEALRIIRCLLHDQEDLINKAVGWMLREIGKRASQETLRSFLDKEAGTMPRVALRYAIERLSPREREIYLKK